MAITSFFFFANGAVLVLHDTDSILKAELYFNVVYTAIYSFLLFYIYARTRKHAAQEKKTRLCKMNYKAKFSSLCTA